MIERAIDSRNKKISSSCKITSSQFHILLEIGRIGGFDLRSLSVRLGLDCSTMSRAIDNLVREDFCKRSVNLKNRRKVSISLTDKGIQTIDCISKNWALVISNIFNDLSEKERVQILASLDKIAERISC